jgi:protein-tyrosine kinase
MGKIYKALNKASTAQQQTIQSQEAEIPLPESSQEPPKNTSFLTSFPGKADQRNSFDKLHPIIAPSTSWDERLRQTIATSSAVAENFRKLRTKILHPNQEAPPRTILITSAVPSEGKGFVTANLGMSVAQSAETKCTMIDCDLRRPTLASLFSLDSGGKGLSNYLRNEFSSWEEAVLPTAQETLYLLPSGPSPENPSELIDSSRMRTLMRDLSQKSNELFLFDSPPISAAAETALLAKLVDKVLVVVRWGTSGREQVKNLIETIGREKIIGIVFNAFEQNALDSIFEKKGYYGYYGYYGKGY